MSATAIETKKEKVKKLKEEIGSSKILLLSDYRGFTVKEITELRKALHKEKSQYNIIKNSLLQRAVEDAGYIELKEYLKGPTALLLGAQDPIAPLKTLVKFIKESEKGEIKAGVMEKAFMGKEDILEIAKLPPREVLLGKVVGGFQAPVYGLVNVLQGTIRKLVYALNAVKEKKATIVANPTIVGKGVSKDG